MYYGLTTQVCKRAWSLVYPAVLHAAKSGVTNKLAGAIVVFVPQSSSIPHDDGLIFIEVIDPFQDPKYEDITKKKAVLSLRTGMPSSRIQQEFPYLYEVGDIKWGGSTVMPGGIVVAFSGVQAVYDEMIAEWMASAIRGLCRWEVVKPDGVMSSESAIIGQT